MEPSDMDQDQPISIETWQWYYKDSANSWVPSTWSDLHQKAKAGIISQDTIVTWEEIAEPGFQFRYTNAEYFYKYQNTIQHAYSETELHAAASEGRINPLSLIWGRMLPSRGIAYSSFRFTDLTFVPSIRDFINARRDKSATILSGSNNAGKSLALKLLRKEIGPSANFLACNRFYHLDYLNQASMDESQYGRRHENFIIQLYQQRQNLENTDYQLPEIISSMKDVDRDHLLRLCTQMLGEEFRLLPVDPENKMTRYHIDVGGQTLAVASSGTRLLMLLVAACLDKHSRLLLIDEPELGLSPRLQSSLARFFYDQDSRKKNCPHLEQLFIATHSHLFLDRSDITNNYTVTKKGNEVALNQIASVSMFHDLQFNMLGNTLESLFLPEAIVIVEGPTDYEYLKHVLEIFLQNNKVSVVKSEGEGDTKNKLYLISTTLGDLATSPFRQRVFVVVDKVHSVKKWDLTKHGLPAKNVVELTLNGIEYYYPHEILSRIFVCDASELPSLMKIRDNTVTVRDIEKTKTELCREVVAHLKPSSSLPEEIRNKLLQPLQQLFV